LMAKSIKISLRHKTPRWRGFAFWATETATTHD
jgi:hypothetical protein